MLTVTIHHHHLFVARFRIHHGFLGCMGVALGLLLALHDRRDWRVWWPARER